MAVKTAPRWLAEEGTCQTIGPTANHFRKSQRISSESPYAANSASLADTADSASTSSPQQKITMRLLLLIRWQASILSPTEGPVGDDTSAMNTSGHRSLHVAIMLRGLAHQRSSRAHSLVSPAHTIIGPARYKSSSSAICNSVFSLISLLSLNNGHSGNTQGFR